MSGSERCLLKSLCLLGVSTTCKTRCQDRPGDTDLCGMRHRDSEVERRPRPQERLRIKAASPTIHTQALIRSPPTGIALPHSLQLSWSRIRTHFYTVYLDVTHMSSQSSNYSIQFKALHYIQSCVTALVNFRPSSSLPEEAPIFCSYGPPLCPPFCRPKQPRNLCLIAQLDPLAQSKPCSRRTSRSGLQENAPRLPIRKLLALSLAYELPYEAEVFFPPRFPVFLRFVF